MTIEIVAEEEPSLFVAIRKKLPENAFATFPEMTPSDGFRLRPDGREGVMLKLAAAPE
jgi:hypothetical protein